MATGLLYIKEDGKDVHAREKSVATPMRDLQYAQLCPGSGELDKLMAEYL